jgi:hypothetical protein
MEMSFAEIHGQNKVKGPWNLDLQKSMADIGRNGHGNKFCRNPWSKQGETISIYKNMES